MSHEITSTDATFSVREMPWMGLLNGQVNVLSDYPTRTLAQKMVHDWEPISEPLYRAVPFFDEQGEPQVRYEESTSAVAQVRSDNGVELAATSHTFTPVTNDEMWDVAEAIQGQNHDVMFETGGSLAGGRKVWILIRLTDPLEVKGDPHGLWLPFFALQNNHDGLGSFRGSATGVRIVCANTFRAADLDSKARGTEFTFAHTKNVGDRVEEARAALAGWRDSIEAFQLLAEHMLTIKIPHGAQVEFLERYIPAPPSALTSERVKRNVDEARGQWLDIYNSVTCEGITGTAWGLLQASSEWSEHVRFAKTAETRFTRAMLNRNDAMAHAKRIALDLVPA